MGNELLKKQNITQFEWCSVHIVVNSENFMMYGMNEANE